jgi:hypothetical protein
MTSSPIPTSLAQGDVQMTTTPPVFADPAMQGLIKAAKEDLAQRLNISVAQISLVEARSVIWPDSSLGCPQPGMQYKQVPEDGARILLQVQKLTYEYHTGGRRGLFLCEKNSKDTYTAPEIDITNLTPPSVDKKNAPPATPHNSISPGEDQ